MRRRGRRSSTTTTAPAPGNESPQRPHARSNGRTGALGRHAGHPGYAPGHPTDWSEGDRLNVLLRDEGGWPHRPGAASRRRFLRTEVSMRIEVGPEATPAAQSRSDPAGCMPGRGADASAISPGSTTVRIAIIVGLFAMAHLHLRCARRRAAGGLRSPRRTAQTAADAASLAAAAVVYDSLLDPTPDFDEAVDQALLYVRGQHQRGPGSLGRLHDGPSTVRRVGDQHRLGAAGATDCVAFYRATRRTGGARFKWALPVSIPRASLGRSAGTFGASRRPASLVMLVQRAAASSARAGHRRRRQQPDHRSRAI